MQAMLDENVPTLPISAVSLSTRGIQKNKSRHHYKQMFENVLLTILPQFQEDRTVLNCLL